MFSQAKKLVGRYEETKGQGDLTVSVTRLYGGRDPFEVLLRRRFNDSEGLRVVQRVVVDHVETGLCQGQNLGIHGEPGLLSTFNDKKIKDMSLRFGRDETKVDIKEFRYVK